VAALHPEVKHEPASDIDTALMDSLKVLDPEGPIREADISQGHWVTFSVKADGLY
jgi:hypothetical protein